MATKEKADALFAEHYCSVWHTDRELCFIHCTKTIEHTIKVLEEVKEQISDDWYKANVNVAIKEQTELLTELKSRL